MMKEDTDLEALARSAAMLRLHLSWQRVLAAYHPRDSCRG